MENQEKKQTRTLDIMYDDIPNITNLRKIELPLMDKANTVILDTLNNLKEVYSLPGISFSLTDHPTHPIAVNIDINSEAFNHYSKNL